MAVGPVLLCQLFSVRFTLLKRYRLGLLSSRCLFCILVFDGFFLLPLFQHFYMFLDLHFFACDIRVRRTTHCKEKIERDEVQQQRHRARHGPTTGGRFRPSLFKNKRQRMQPSCPAHLSEHSQNPDAEIIEVAVAERIIAHRPRFFQWGAPVVCCCACQRRRTPDRARNDAPGANVAATTIENIRYHQNSNANQLTEPQVARYNTGGLT